MNTETGEILKFKDNEELKAKMAELENKHGRNDILVPIEESDLTETQKEKMKVSKFDYKSKLGKMFLENRAQRRKRERSERKQANKKFK